MVYVRKIFLLLFFTFVTGCIVNASITNNSTERQAESYAPDSPSLDTLPPEMLDRIAGYIGEDDYSSLEKFAETSSSIQHKAGLQQQKYLNDVIQKELYHVHNQQKALKICTLLGSLPSYYNHHLDVETKETFDKLEVKIIQLRNITSKQWFSDTSNEEIENILKEIQSNPKIKEHLDQLEYDRSYNEIENINFNLNQNSLPKHIDPPFYDLHDHQHMEKYKVLGQESQVHPAYFVQANKIQENYEENLKKYYANPKELKQQMENLWVECRQEIPRLKTLQDIQTFKTKIKKIYKEAGLPNPFYNKREHETALSLLDIFIQRKHKKIKDEIHKIKTRLLEVQENLKNQKEKINTVVERSIKENLPQHFINKLQIQKNLVDDFVEKNTKLYEKIQFPLDYNHQQRFLKDFRENPQSNHFEKIGNITADINSLEQEFNELVNKNNKNLSEPTTLPADHSHLPQAILIPNQTKTMPQDNASGHLQTEHFPLKEKLDSEKESLKLKEEKVEPHEQVSSTHRAEHSPHTEHARESHFRE